MWPDRVSNPGPLTYSSDALLTALRGPAILLSAFDKLNFLEVHLPVSALSASAHSYSLDSFDQLGMTEKLLKGPYEPNENMLSTGLLSKET